MKTSASMQARRQRRRKGGSGNGLLAVIGLGVLAWVLGQDRARDVDEPASISASIDDVVVAQEVCMHQGAQRIPKEPGDTVLVRTSFVPDARNSLGQPVSWTFRVYTAVSVNVTFQPGFPGGAFGVTCPPCVEIDSTPILVSAAQMGEPVTLGTIPAPVIPPRGSPGLTIGMTMDVVVLIEYLRPGRSGANPQDWVPAKDSSGNQAFFILEQVIQVVETVPTARITGVTVAQALPALSDPAGRIFG